MRPKRQNRCTTVVYREVVTNRKTPEARRITAMPISKRPKTRRVAIASARFIMRTGRVVLEAGGSTSRKPDDEEVQVSRPIRARSHNARPVRNRIQKRRFPGWSSPMLDRSTPLVWGIRNRIKNPPCAGSLVIDVKIDAPKCLLLLRTLLPSRGSWPRQVEWRAYGRLGCRCVVVVVRLVWHLRLGRKVEIKVVEGLGSRDLCCHGHGACGTEHWRVKVALATLVPCVLSGSGGVGGGGGICRCWVPKLL